MGLFYSLLSALFATAKDLVSKRLAFRLDGTTSTFASFFFALPFYVVLLLILWLLGQADFALTRDFLLLVLLRSVTDTFAEGLKMHALAHGDLSVVAIFFSISPLFLLITSPLITEDPLSVPGVVAVVLVVGGSLALVYRPSAVHWAGQQKGIVLAAGASLFFSLNTCFDRRAVKDVKEATSIFAAPAFAGFSMTLISALFLLPLVLGRVRRQALLHPAHQGGLWVRGALEIAFMVSKLTALQYLSGPDVVALQRISLVLTIIGGRVFFREPDFARRLAAGALILAGVFVIAYYQTPPAVSGTP